MATCTEHGEWPKRFLACPKCFVDGYPSRPASRDDDEVLAVPVQDILREIDHIEKNGISLKKFGGDEIHEGRCRELCAMYLREFIQAEAMGKRLMKTPFFARSERLPNKWVHFDAAYKKACESSQPQDWLEAALMAQQVRHSERSD